MRVIGGQYKGKRLFSPGNNARPTTDRIKESLFNILFSKRQLNGARVLDVFAGSGALGIEALSRGAAHAVFVDLERAAVACIKDNLAHVGVAANAEVYCVPADLALKKLSGRMFDLIFIDPPYNFGHCRKALERIVEFGLVKSGGMVVVEHSVSERLPDLENFAADARKMGQTCLTFLEYLGREVNNEY